MEWIQDLSTTIFGNSERSKNCSNLFKNKKFIYLEKTSLYLSFCSCDNWLLWFPCQPEGGKGHQYIKLLDDMDWVIKRSFPFAHYLSPFKCILYRKIVNWNKDPSKIEILKWSFNSKSLYLKQMCIMRACTHTVLRKGCLPMVSGDLFVWGTEPESRH